MYRAGIIKINGETEAQNFDSKEDAEIWVLEQVDEGIKKSIIVNKDNIEERYAEDWEERK